MKPLVGIAGCSTIEAELTQCCQELGLPTRLYASRPACLFAEAQQEIERLVAEAAEQHDSLIVAMGRCCGPLHVAGGARVAAARCTEMLLGSGTYEWHADRGLLTLPAPYFGKWLQAEHARAEVERFLASRTVADTLKGVVAVDEGERSPDPRGVAAVERMIGRPPARLFTGLGHLRETLRETAQRAGIALTNGHPAPIAAAALGPGDDCLLVRADAAAPPAEAARAVGDALARGLVCYWLVGETAPEHMTRWFRSQLPDFDACVAGGDLNLISTPQLIADSGASDEPQALVVYWVARAIDALGEGRGGVCMMHGAGWSRAAGLADEYVLDYTSRLSAACVKWPILSLFEVVEPDAQPSLLEELARTHPLLWTEGRIGVNRGFMRSNEYLGGEDLLDALAAGGRAVDCAEVAPLISALADGELEGAAAVALTRHAETCATCRDLLRRHRETKSALSPLRAGVEEIADGLWARISRALAEEE